MGQGPLQAVACSQAPEGGLAAAAAAGAVVVLWGTELAAVAGCLHQDDLAMRPRALWVIRGIHNVLVHTFGALMLAVEQAHEPINQLQLSHC
jgi:hypothetical protein